jgi:hypothetical protein
MIGEGIPSCKITSKWDFSPVSCPFGVIDRRPEPLPDAGRRLSARSATIDKRVGLFRRVQTNLCTLPLPKKRYQGKGCLSED